MDTATAEETGLAALDWFGCSRSSDPETDSVWLAYSKADRERICGQCFECVHAREVPGNAHILCVRPDADMVGHPHGIRKGWFMYPLLFDPTWKLRLCRNFQSNAISPAISQPISEAVSLQHDE